MSNEHRFPRRIGAAAAASALAAGAAFVAVTVVAMPSAHASTTCIPQVTSVPFGYTGGLQYFTVPHGVSSLDLTVAGAAGGGSDDPLGEGFAGGNGAVLDERGVPVSQGSVLSVLVGGVGATSVFGGGGGGGGGSFVYTAPTLTGLLVAAGGGGGGEAFVPGLDASTGPDGVTPVYAGIVAGGQGGSGGFGGAAGSGYTFGYGAGGGGLLSAGGDSASGAGGGGGIAAGGVGGAGVSGGGGGGFGGGGGGAQLGGGGGGFSGGGGGGNGQYAGGGGGGGSYVVSGATSVSAAATNTGDGSVSISYVVDDTVTFDTAGGSTVDAQSVPDGCTATQPTDPTKDNATFDGWFAPGATTPYDFTTPVTGDLTLTAHWTPVSTLPAGCTAAGLEVGNQLTATSPTSGKRGKAGTWSFVASVHNCTTGTVSGTKLQGGTAGWLTAASATTNLPGGSVAISPNVKNKGQVVSWSPFTLTSGQTGSITVTVTGTVAKGATCGSQLPLAGVWGASGADPTGTKLSGTATTIPTITVTC